MRMLQTIERIHAVLYIAVPPLYAVLMWFLPSLEGHDPRWSQWVVTGTLLMLLYDYSLQSVVGFAEGWEAGGPVRGLVRAVSRMRQRLLAYALGVVICVLVLGLAILAWLTLGGPRTAAAVRPALKAALPIYGYQLKSLAVAYAMLATVWGMGEVLLRTFAGVSSADAED